MTRKIKVVVLLAVVFAILGAWLWLFYRDGGVTHRELADIIAAEGVATRMKIDARCDALDGKLDRIDAKLDKLLQIAAPRLPDGMKAVD